METNFWYVAQTKPRQEGIALVNLERQGFVVNLPRIPLIKPSPRLPDSEVPFPGYTFLRLIRPPSPSRLCEAPSGCLFW
jgi:transcriptional antiterminator RfaH